MKLHITIRWNQIERNWYRQDQEYQYYQIPDNCFYAVIDPDRMMPDIVRTNNSTKRKFKMNFIFDKPSYYHTDVNIIPWLFSYNTYNGFTPGISQNMVVFCLGMGVILQRLYCL